MSRWISVKMRLPDKAGKYLVAYYPCYWDDVQLTRHEVGIDTFRGKSSWAKKKFQRVTHWMELPEPPKEKVECACATCEHRGWNMPQCAECTTDNGMKWWSKRKESE